MAYNEPINSILDESGRARAKRLRATCPDAYALTVNEAARVDKISTLILTFFANHPEYRQEERREGSNHPIYHDVYNADSVALITELLRLKRISFTNAYTLAKRVLSSKWFVIDSTIVLDAEGKVDFTKRLASVTTDEGYKGVIDRAEYPEFYKLWDSESVYIYAEADAIRQALSLTGYKLLDNNEHHTLNLIIMIQRFLDEAKPFVIAQDGFIPITNSPETTAILAVGSKALRDASYDDMNERYDIVTATGDSIYLRGQRLLTTSSEWVNIDKLLRQINYKSYQDSHANKEVVITLDEFMELRGLSDRKEARKQFTKVIDDLFNLSCKTKNSKYGEIRYVQNKPVIKNSQVSFALSDFYLAALIYYSSISLLPTSFMRIDGRGSNAYKIAVYLSDHKRRNLNKSNENKVTIAKLLEITSLPDAKTIEPNHYKQQIIDPFFAALEKAKSTGEFTYTLSRRGDDACNTVEAHYDYNYFITCTVNVQWLKEPDYTQLRERKAKEAEAYERGRLKAVEAKGKADRKAKEDKPVKRR